MRWIIWLVVLGLGLPLLAQDNASPITPELQANLDELVAYTEQARGLTLNHEISTYFPTREDVTDYITEQFSISLTDAVIAEQTRFYVNFNFMPSDVDLRALFSGFYTSQVGGFYNPETEEMNVLLLAPGSELEEDLPLTEQIVYVHEYVHALQDSNFDLTAYLEESDSMNNDEILARLSLVEGDAALVMNLYSVQRASDNPIGTTFSLLFGGLQAGNLFLPPNIPPIITNEVLFPYNTGMELVQALYAENSSWESVNAAFTNPPTSSEQILHPEAYFNNDQPIAVELEDKSATLEGWTLGNDNVLGEFYLRQFLGQELSTRDLNPIATGWGGDRYHIYTGELGDVLVIKFAWDTPEDAQEFSDGIALYAERRFGVEANAEGCYVTESLAFCVLDDTIIQAPTQELALLFQ
jgi:hypothetical protein